ncbi:divergent polysaccharide deacteylase family protein [uncultured Roseovarius sp.]|uniref:divergent polysaccharide deacteylase family protein n=1 Tax=uncultured Roseovarius sp. TaxID=293344 RepID=UPI0026269BBF|nr:divergent polysaccharide deacetylase family protein [uncultured Roseovarius sp.]
MARGTLSGMIAGTVVSGLVVGTASVMTEVPGAGAPDATAIEVPAGSEFDQSRDDTQADLPETQETPDAGDVAKIAAPEPDDLSTIDTDATQSAAQPETDDADLAMNAPDAGDSGAGIAVDTDSPVLPSPQANAPEAPASEEELSISTEPAQPALPEPSEEESAFPEQSAPEGEGAALDTGETPAQDGDTTAEDTVTGMATEPEADLPQAEKSDAAEATETTTDESAESVDVQDQVTEPALPIVEAPDALPEETPTPPEEDTAALAEPEKPSGTITNIAPNVTTNRLPSVTAEPEPPADAGSEDGVTEEDVAQDAAPAPDDDSLPPIKRFAAAFENPDDKPMMSIVLIDDGSSPIGLEALKSFPYPLNFAVDTGWPGAGDAMQKYREAGFEVLAMIDLPEGASATDTEVSVQAYLERVPQAVAIMEGDEGGLQANRDASGQLAQILRDSGHGAVMFPNGLNTAQKLIAREGVPSASVFRDFDAKGQNATVIRRFLDQAAFRAGQEEKGVIMVGRLRADTISALLLWGLQDRAGRVAVAPVSAVLTAE